MASNGIAPEPESSLTDCDIASNRSGVVCFALLLGTCMVGGMYFVSKISFNYACYLV